LTKTDNLTSMKIVAGPMKTATTWIHEYLESRGDICLPSGTKETFYFDRNFEQGFDWYKDHFNNCADKPKIEVAPSYFHCENVPQRIKEKLGTTHIVFILRDPIERTFSHYLHMLRYGKTTDNLKKAIQAHPEILNASKYHAVINAWKSVFGAENISILYFENLLKDQERFTHELCLTLSLEYVEPVSIEGESVNSRQKCLHPALAFVVRKLADQLRKRRLYSIVNFLKATGLKSLIFGGKPDKLPKLSEEEAAWLYSELVEDIEKFIVNANFDINLWREYNKASREISKI